MDQTAVSQSAPNKLGKYEIRKLLGKGNMGVVFLAHDPVLERDVAIKVMAASSIYDAEMKERFEREAKAIARLHHPNIVTIHDLGYDHQGAPFIAMELLQGKDLEDLIKADELTIVRRLEVIAQVCRGLNNAHAAGIVHRDVKPANIFVTKDGAKIMDFGVARWMQASQTQSGAVLGTASYMSPEQIRGEKVDGRSDIFSLGIVLYQMLTNKKLYDGDNIETVFFKTLSQDPPDLVLPDGRDLPELQKILMSALATEIEDRFANAEAMADAIEAFLRTHSDLVPEKAIFISRDAKADSSTNVVKGSLRTLSSQPTATLTPEPVPSTAVRPASSTDPRPATRRPPLPKPRPRPPAPSRLPWLAAPVLVLAVAGITYFLAFAQPDTSVSSSGTTDSAPAPIDLEQRFQFAEELLANGQIAQAFEAVQNILTIDPNNPRALELQEAIHTAADERAQMESQQTTSPVETPTQIEPSTPTPREQAASMAADAALAISNGELERAESLIARGRRIDPNNPRWSELNERLRSEQAELELKSQAARYLREASLALDGGDYQDAIDAYKKAIEYSPESTQAQEGLERAISLKHQAEAQAAAAPARQFVESKTTFAPSQSETQEVVGFEMEDRFQVNETADAFFPAHIIIELNPPDAKPGEPYVLRVRVFNEGYRPLEVRTLELVSKFGDRTTGAGSPIPSRTERIAPQATALIHEISGTWKEAQNHGSITATVTLADGGKFSKSLSW